MNKILFGSLYLIGAAFGGQTSIQCFDGPKDSFDCIKISSSTTSSNSNGLRIFELQGLDLGLGDLYSTTITNYEDAKAYAFRTLTSEGMHAFWDSTT